MSDKEIILNTLDFIKYNNGHTEVKSLWKELDNETKTRIKIKLEENNLATPHIYDAWSLMITTNGLKVKQKDLKEDGNLKKRFVDKDHRKTIKTTLLGVVVGGLLTGGVQIAIEMWPSKKQTQTIVLPKIQFVRDTVIKTIYLEDSTKKK